MTFNMKHVAVLGACLASIGAMMGSLQDWQQATTPAFIGGAIGVVGSNIAAMFTARPNE